MGKTIYNLSLSDLMPPNMLKEPRIQALCAALDAQTRLTTDNIKKVVILADIQGQNETVTDYLAAQMHVDFYNQELTLETRRNLVAGSGFLHRIKGTPAAVEQVVKTVFGSAQVQEWFEYGGQPYCFRVLINEFPNSESQIDEVKRAVKSSQNIRSFLDDVIIIAPVTKANMYIGCYYQIAININTAQKPVTG